MKKVKKETLAVWRYLAEHGEINNKVSLPIDLFITIQSEMNQCQLCSVFNKQVVYNESTDTGLGRTCKGCPLYPRDKKYGRRGCAIAFDKWVVGDSAERAEAAGEIVKLVEAWEV